MMTNLFSDDMPSLAEIEKIACGDAGAGLIKLSGSIDHMAMANQMMVVLILNERKRTHFDCKCTNMASMKSYYDGITSFLDEFNVAYTVSDNKREIFLPGETFISFHLTKQR